MGRRAALFAFLMVTAGCATPPPDPVVWYVVSPNPTENFPHGNINSPMTTWAKLRTFPSADECRDAIRGIRNELHRPANCVASNDPRLMQR